MDHDDVINVSSRDFGKTLYTLSSKGYSYQIWTLRWVRDTNQCWSSVKCTDDTHCKMTRLLGKSYNTCQQKLTLTVKLC